MNLKQAITTLALAVGIAGCNYQGGTLSRVGLGDAAVNLEQRCSTLNTAGKFVAGKNSETKFSDCITPEGAHILKEHSTFGIIESSYEFVPQSTPGTGGYQGGWGSRLGTGDQKLAIPSDCKSILNVGKSGSKKYIVCESPEGTTYMREFSDWGIFEATYIFTPNAKKDLYQGGWFSRLGGSPQLISLPNECKSVKSAGRTGSTKFIDCELENGDRLLREFTDFGVFEATYIFSKNKPGDFYQGGWTSRLGSKPTILHIPDECNEIKNVGKAGSTKYIVCTSKTGNAPLMQEYSDFGVFEATYRFVKSN